MYRILVQRAAKNVAYPKNNELKHWAKTALETAQENAEITIRIVTTSEITELNNSYRKKNYATNVLSFPFDLSEQDDLDLPLLGDLVICASVVNEEAEQQHKSNESHWAHMVVHGCLHLLGYDHENNADAEIMENKEIILMQKLGFKNPYDI